MDQLEHMTKNSQC